MDHQNHHICEKGHTKKSQMIEQGWIYTVIKCFVGIERTEQKNVVSGWNKLSKQLSKTVRWPVIKCFVGMERTEQRHVVSGWNKLSKQLSKIIRWPVIKCFVGMERTEQNPFQGWGMLCTLATSRMQLIALINPFSFKVLHFLHFYIYCIVALSNLLHLYFLFKVSILGRWVLVCTPVN